MDTYTFRAVSPWKEELRYGFVLRNANVIMAETQTCLDHARKYLRGPEVQFAPSCLWESDLRAVEARWQVEGYSPSRRPVIFFAGRIIRRKNLHDLIAAFHRVCAAFPERSIEMRGPVMDQAYHTELQEQVGSLGLADRVRFLPPVSGDELFRIYRETEVFALPSEGEGFPSAIIEVMYFGGAIVAATSGYVGDQLAHGECALIHYPHDVDTLAEHLKRLMESPHLREHYRRAARERMVRVYTWERYFPDLERRFLELTGHGLTSSKPT